MSSKKIQIALPNDTLFSIRAPDSITCKQIKLNIKNAGQFEYDLDHFILTQNGTEIVYRDTTVIGDVFTEKNIMFELTPFTALTKPQRRKYQKMSRSLSSSNLKKQSVIQKKDPSPIRSVPARKTSGGKKLLDAQGIEKLKKEKSMRSISPLRSSFSRRKKKDSNDSKKKSVDQVKKVKRHESFRVGTKNSDIESIVSNIVFFEPPDAIPEIRESSSRSNTFSMKERASNQFSASASPSSTPRGSIIGRPTMDPYKKYRQIWNPLAIESDQYKIEEHDEIDDFQIGLDKVLYKEKHKYPYRDIFSKIEHDNYTAKDKNGDVVIISVGSTYDEGRDVTTTKLLHISVDDQVLDSFEIQSILKASGSVKSITNKLKEKKIKKLKLIEANDEFVQNMIRLERKLMVDKYEIGILYAKEGQLSEEEMYSNEHGSELFQTFLNILGETVELKEFDGYAGGLDINNNTTGTHSIFTEWLENHIMFHVSTFLPFVPIAPQQLERKRHLGNDVVLILFKEGNTPLNVSNIISQFIHIVLIIQPIVLKDRTDYQISCLHKNIIRNFEPALENPIIVEKKVLKDVLLSKAINGSREAMNSPLFINLKQKTRRMELSQLSDSQSQ